MFGVNDATSSGISKERASEDIDKTLRVKWQGGSKLLNQTSALVINDATIISTVVNEGESDQVDYLINLAKISAAVSNYKKFALESRKADSSVMEVFWKIEAVSSVGTQTQNLYSSVKETYNKKIFL